MIEYFGEETNEETGYREYICTNKHRYISETTLLSLYEDTTSLKGWQERLGIEEANRISNEVSGKGKVCHSQIEAYFSAKTADTTDYFDNTKQAINAFYSKVRPIENEKAIFYSDPLNPVVRVAGRYDSVAYIEAGTFHTLYSDQTIPEGEYVIDLKNKFDYVALGKKKTATIPRVDTVTMILKNLLQGSAYVTILNTRYNRDIKGFILVYATKSKSKLVYLPLEDIAFYWGYQQKLMLDYYGLEKLDMDWKCFAALADFDYDVETNSLSNHLPLTLY